MIFGWVMHEQAIIDGILAQLPLEGCQVHAVSMVCSEDALKARLRKDIDAGLRTPDVIVRSLARLPMYDVLDTQIIDTTHMTIEEAAKAIAQK